MAVKSMCFPSLFHQSAQFLEAKDIKFKVRKHFSLKGAVSRNSAKLGNYKMPIKLRET